MAKLSSINGKKANVPKLRFPEFTEEWEANNIGEISTYIKGAPLSKSDISETGTPFILYGELYTTYKEVTTEIKRKTNCIVDKKYFSKIGDVVIPTSGETPEEIATATCVMTPNVILAGDLNIFRINDIDGRFFSYVINHKVNKDISRIAQGKSIVHIKGEEISKIQIKYPSSEEQQKILSFIELLSLKIEKQERLIEKLKKYKRGLSNKLFEDYANNWTIANFADVFKILQNNTFSRVELTCEETEILNIHYGDVLIKYGDILDLSKVCDIPFIKNNIDLKRYTETSYLKNGDVVIADTAEDYTVGKTIEIFSATGKRVLSGLHTIPCRPLISFEAKYLGYYLNSYNFRKQILPLIQGTKVSSISKSKLKKVKVKYPEQKEQKRIVSILSLIDEKIYIAEHQLTSLKICKDGLLQQMFI